MKQHQFTKLGKALYEKYSDILDSLPMSFLKDASIVYRNSNEYTLYCRYCGNMGYSKGLCKSHYQSRPKYRDISPEALAEDIQAQYPHPLNFRHHLRATLIHSHQGIMPTIDHPEVPDWLHWMPEFSFRFGELPDSLFEVGLAPGQVSLHLERLETKMFGSGLRALAVRQSDGTWVVYRDLPEAEVKHLALELPDHVVVKHGVEDPHGIQDIFSRDGWYLKGRFAGIRYRGPGPGLPKPSVLLHPNAVSLSEPDCYFASASFNV